jgi:hypothetical protein
MAKKSKKLSGAALPENASALGDYQAKRNKKASSKKPSSKKASSKKASSKKASSKKASGKKVSGKKASKKKTPNKKASNEVLITGFTRFVPGERVQYTGSENRDTYKNGAKGKVVEDLGLNHLVSVKFNGNFSIDFVRREDLIRI